MKTPYILFAIMRKLFIISGGLTNDFISWVISFFRPFTTPQNQTGVLGHLTAQDVQKISSEIEEKGYYVFDSKLSEDAISDLVNLATKSDCIPCKTSKKVKFGEEPGYPRYDLEPNNLVKNKTVCGLVSDETLRGIAGTYLKSTPICDLIVMWWSLPATQKISEAAQMYHFDMDRFKFLKFFFYLTDVDENTGPHCFVEGSHLNVPLRLRRDGRFTDEQIESLYGTEKIKKFMGKKGTILAVDTRGFHKGEKLNHCNRLIFQLEFSNSLFGMNYPYLDKKNINPDYLETFNKYPSTYLRIFK